MRCSQPLGLPSSADAFLAANVKQRNPCSHCGRHDGYASKQIGEYGMFDELPLFEYELKDGRTAQEWIQYEFWSSGPMTWLELRVSDGTAFRWTKEEMVAHSGLEKIMFKKDNGAIPPTPRGGGYPGSNSMNAFVPAISIPPFPFIVEERNPGKWQAYVPLNSTDSNEAVAASWELYFYIGCQYLLSDPQIDKTQRLVDDLEYLTNDPGMILNSGREVHEWWVSQIRGLLENLKKK